MNDHHATKVIEQMADHWAQEKEEQSQLERNKELQEVRNSQLNWDDVVWVIERTNECYMRCIFCCNTKIDTGKKEDAKGNWKKGREAKQEQRTRNRLGRKINFKPRVVREGRIRRRITRT